MNGGFLRVFLKSGLHPPLARANLPPRGDPSGTARIIPTHPEP
jgi:hypothetical protein